MVSKTSTKGISLILALIMVLGILMPASALAAASDIEGHWAQTVIVEWMDGGLAGGYDDGTFRPNNPVTRAEFMAFTNRAFGFSAQADITFSDVSEDAWYAGVVKVAVGAGYVSGYPDGTMRPDSPITRQEAAVILSQVAYLSGNAAEADGFSDEARIPAWSRAYVGAVADAGLMVGYPDASFRPVNNITRAEAVSALSNAKAFLTVYAEAGTYGPVTGSLTLEGNVVILVEDVVLQNITVKGDLILAEGIGEGDATLNNVTVEGNTFIRGGGTNSIYINGGSYNNIFVERVGGSVRVVAIDASGVNIVLATQPESDDEEIILEGSFDSITVTAPNVKVTLQGETIVQELKVEETASSVTISTTSTVTVEKAIIETKTTFTGEGTIEEASGAAAGESTYENEPEMIIAPPADDDEPATGGGGGGGAVTPALEVETVRMISTTSTGLGTDLTTLNDDDRITGISFVTASTSVTLNITGIESENMNIIYERSLSNLAGPDIEIPLSSLLPAGFSGDSISMGSLRDAFGTWVTIKGTLSASGYTSYATPIEITLGPKQEATSIWHSIDLNTTDKTITATLTSAGSAEPLSSFDITAFLDASGDVLPAEVKFGGNPEDVSGWILVAEENSEDMIDAMLALTGASSLSEATMSDLVGKDIFLKSPGGVTYYLNIIPQK